MKAKEENKESGVKVRSKENSHERSLYSRNAPQSPFSVISNLQRSIGNKSVSQILRKRKDSFESLVQMQEVKEEEEEEKLQAQKAEEEEEEEIQRQEEEEEEEEVIQQKEDHVSDSSFSPFQVINETRGQGETFPSTVKNSMENFFGYDLSPVRIHNDSRADSLARTFGARAFTTGTDIYFRRGEYQPDSKEGMELLGHETTHVIQQSEGLPSDAGKPGDRFEQEADMKAKTFLEVKDRLDKDDEEA